MPSCATSTLTTPSPNDTIPLIVFIAYQMMFAIITPALITGAFANRVTFKAYFIFLTLWLLFVYFPFVHMVWGGGLLAKWGVLDFAGGIVVHNIAGIAALASVLYVGRRRVKDPGPHSIPLVALGTGLLWFGWYGFNAGSEFRVDATTATAFLNTDLAASFAGVAWFFVEWVDQQKPKFLGLLTGSVAGLATITPAAGYVSPTSAVIIGLVSGVVCFYAVALKNRLHWDDALDVWGVHGVGGFIGIVMLGRVRHQGVQPGRRGRPARRQCRVLRQAVRRGGVLVGLGVRVHARHAVADRSRDAGQGGRGCRGAGARRVAARRDRPTRSGRREPEGREPRAHAARGGDGGDGRRGRLRAPPSETPKLGQRAHGEPCHPDHAERDRVERDSVRNPAIRALPPRRREPCAPHQPGGQHLQRERRAPGMHGEGAGQIAARQQCERSREPARRATHVRDASEPADRLAGRESEPGSQRGGRRGAHGWPGGAVGEGGAGVAVGAGAGMPIFA